MKNFLKKLLAGAVLVTTALSSFACAGKKDPNAGKATLYVYSFTKGFGDEWLKSLIADYEALHVNTEINGKKGIHIEPTAVGEDAGDIANRDEVIYFLEQQDYYQLMASTRIADITDAVKGENPYDAAGRTLEDKMFDDQKAYFGRTINGETRYFAYPHYLTTFGIVYDVELFDSMGYYFADGYDPAGDLQFKFLGSFGGKKTAGPDGEYNTSDDGLPTTYEEFLWLCDYISGAHNPLLWTGQFRDSYLMHFINALATDYNGYEQTRLNYTFNGTATNLGTIVDGVFVEDAEDTVIDGENGAELARQAGKYYAMKFYEDLYKKTYINEKSDSLFGDKYDQYKAQEDFLIKATKRNAMLLEGNWWNEEATPVFENTSVGKPELSKQNRKLGWMPLPKANADMVDGSSTLYDIYYPLCVMKNGLDANSWEYKYAIDFIQFANSDAQLAKFTQITGTTKALKYELTPDQYKGLSCFGKSFYDHVQKSKIVFPYDNNLLFANNQKSFQSLDWGQGSPLYKSKVDGCQDVCVVSAIRKGTATAAQWFSGMHSYFVNHPSVQWKKSK